MKKKKGTTKKTSSSEAKRTLYGNWWKQFKFFYDVVVAEFEDISTAT